MTIFLTPVTYRGLSIETNTWYYGSYIEKEMYPDYYRCFIAPNEVDNMLRLDGENWIYKIVEIRIETLGVYIGKADIDETPIYSGDIIEKFSPGNSDAEPELFIIVYGDGYIFGDGGRVLEFKDIEDCRVIGNMHTDKELFKKVNALANKRKGIPEEEKYFTTLFWEE